MTTEIIVVGANTDVAKIIDSLDMSGFKVIEFNIGSPTSFDNWPTPDLAGLVKALRQWTLDPLMEMGSGDETHPHHKFEAPFRGLAWGHCEEEYVPHLGRTRYVGTKPIHSAHPDAVRYTGNFLHNSFGFWLDTDDQELIRVLDHLIAENMKRPEYIKAAKVNRDRIRGYHKAA